MKSPERPINTLHTLPGSHMGSPLLCVVGPTATGKSALAVALGKRLGGEIISCDSVQVYEGFDIGSAKITEDEQEGVTHHLLSVARPEDPWTAGRFAAAARDCLCGIRGRGRLPIVCGGTGLWLRALTEGLADIPPCPRLDHGENPYEALCAIDPATAERLSANDKRRIDRALDVFAHTGRTLSSFFAEQEKAPLPTLMIGLDYDNRDDLRRQIRRRTDAMVRGGLWEETRDLLEKGVSPQAAPMHSLGYAQAVGYLSGRLTEAEARDEIALRTAQYAKRQRTWFRGQTDTKWFAPPQIVNNFAKILKTVEKCL